MPRAFTKLTVCCKIGANKPFNTAVVSGAVSVSANSPVYSTVTPLIRPPAKSIPMWPIRSHKSKYGWITCKVAFVIGDALTAVATGSPRNTCATPLATSVATPAWASRVDAPICGVNATFGMLRNGLFSGNNGSWAHTSMPAAATLPDLRAAAKASTSIIAPRAAFTMYTPSFILAISSAPIMPRVSSVNGVCKVM